MDGSTSCLFRNEDSLAVSRFGISEWNTTFGPSASQFMHITHTLCCQDKSMKSIWNTCWLDQNCTPTHNEKTFFLR